MKIMGIDPGSYQCGWAVISGDSLEDYGVVALAKKNPIEQRLKDLYERLFLLIEKHRPEKVALEEGFVYKNPASAMVLAYVRAMVMLLCAQHTTQLCYLSATHAKKCFTGNGHASKEDMIAMVRMLYGVDLPSDAADGVALAHSLF